MKDGNPFSLGASFLSVVCCLPAIAGEEAAAKPVSYYSAVRPILVKSCQGCHQPAKASGKIALADYGQLIKAVHDDKKVVIVVVGCINHALRGRHGDTEYATHLVPSFRISLRFRYGFFT